MMKLLALGAAMIYALSNVLCTIYNIMYSINPTKYPKKATGR